MKGFDLHSGVLGFQCSGGSLCESATQLAEIWAEQFSLNVWWATRVEINSAIARLDRSRELSLAAKLNAFEYLADLQRTWNEIAPTDDVRQLALALLRNYPLRAADALQLAAALVWCRERPAGRTFICADARLCEAAALAGFTVLAP